MATKLEVHLEICGRTGMCIMRFPVVTPDETSLLSEAELAEIIDTGPTGSIYVAHETATRAG